MTDNHPPSNQGEAERKPLPDIILAVPRKYFALLMVVYALSAAASMSLGGISYFASLGIALVAVLPVWYYGWKKAKSDPGWLKDEEEDG
ncbi:hypothetical protein [Pseudodesulfovibrio pelocollis]|uniref:hypothetical protein n=1 Tax=Pseudodesulfovibrio pelocollis TaxID=3051432 RepID=UPI00255AA5A9|nr:hypothetical protein [Pseudodesulfovibrio sp. SB368]